MVLGLGSWILLLYLNLSYNCMLLSSKAYSFCIYYIILAFSYFLLIIVSTKTLKLLVTVKIQLQDKYTTGGHSLPIH